MCRESLRDGPLLTSRELLWWLAKKHGAGRLGELGQVHMKLDPVIPSESSVFLGIFTVFHRPPSPYRYNRHG